MARIGLVGAGFIARVHAEAILALPGHRITAVIDPNRAAADRLARDFGAPPVFASVAEALAADAFERAHVLVPPDLHAATAAEILAAGKPVLLEKPLATSAAECDALLAAASAAPLGVNQNFVHHPAFVRLREAIEAGRLGKPSFVSCLYNVPLRQLAARQFGHWMFRRPENILLEQAVHPLSQIMTLAGPFRAVATLPGAVAELTPGQSFVATHAISLSGERLPAQLRFAVGQNFPLWQITVICDDGAITADILGNRVATQTRTRWMEVVDGAVSGLATAGALARGSVANAAATLAGTLKLRGRSDPFFLSMRASIAAFHGAVDAGRPPVLDAAFGAALVRACETIRDQAFPAAAEAAPATPRASEGDAAAPDVLVLGGTGFIGTHLVHRLLEAGKRVAVLARTITALPPVFHDPRVTLIRGDIRDRANLDAAIAGVPVVVNLAHGGASGSWEQVRDAMVGGAETVARLCLDHHVHRLIHVGSIAGLYLGPQPAPVTGATPPDERADERADYARAKALCDRMLLDLHAREGLPIVILRPGIVTGAGGIPFHSGLGFYNTEQHCIGWNDGRNPLPFVLVEDVADAIARAIDAPGIDGRAYNLVGDVRLTAREYIAELATALGRPLRFHPQSATGLWAEDLGKWAVKRATGRAVPVPSRRDFLSRGMTARFDIVDAARDLGWHPVADRDAFLARGVSVYAS